MMPFLASIFSPSKTPRMPAVQVVQPPTDEAAQQAKEKAAADQRRAAQMAKGRATTILTGGEGVTGQAPVKLKELFGE
jgi:hypothetical protein